jgi:hypothetical protein
LPDFNRSLSVSVQLHRKLFENVRPGTQNTTVFFAGVLVELMKIPA